MNEAEIELLACQIANRLAARPPFPTYAVRVEAIRSSIRAFEATRARGTVVNGSFAVGDRCSEPRPLFDPEQRAHGRD